MPTKASAPKRFVQGKDRHITIEEVAEHYTADDFWTVIDGVVYDMSGFLDVHPGGAIVMNAAGTDCTVLFHTYHLLHPDKAQALLVQRRIGVLVGKSPIMGAFYWEVAQRAREELQNEKRRPLRAKVLWVLDAVALCGLLAGGLFSTAMTPLWLLMLLHLGVPILQHGRMEGHQHANGHQQIWESGLSGGADLIGMALGAGLTYGVPAQRENPRRMLHLPRAVAQYELGVNGRGEAEHVALHHVYGADLEHDRCSVLASMWGARRISSRQVHNKWLHPQQHSAVLQLFVHMIGELAFASGILRLPERARSLHKFLVSDWDWLRAAAVVLSMVSIMLGSRCYFLLLISSPAGTLVFTCSIVGRCLAGVMVGQAFFAQHVWESQVSAAATMQDWGRHTVETCFSWWGANSQWHPLLWGAAGACPATLSYHLEHTLFPGVSYLHLPKIAPVVLRTCEQLGVRYHRLGSLRALLRAEQEMLAKHAAAPA